MRITSTSNQSRDVGAGRWRGASRCAIAHQGEDQARLEGRCTARPILPWQGEAGITGTRGLDLDVISGSGSSDTIKQIGSKAVEFGLVDALVLVQGAQQRVPAKSIAAYYQTTPIVLISPQAKPVTNPRQLLDGIKLGSKKGSATFQGLVALLAANNMQLEQIKLVDIGFGVQPLLVKQVDAIMGFSMNEPIEAESGGMAVSLMPVSDYGVNTYGLTIVSNPDFMQQKPEVVKAFMRATLRSVAETVKDPAAAVARSRLRLPRPMPSARPRCWSTRCHIGRARTPRREVSAGRPSSGGVTPSTSRANSD